MFLGFVVKDEWVVIHLAVVIRDHEIVLNDVVLPDLHNLRVESLSVVDLAHRREELAHVKVAFAQVDRLWAMLLALLVDAASQLFDRFLVAIGSVLCHEKAAKCYVKGCMITL